MGEVKISKQEQKELKHHTRRLSIKEGMFWSIRNSLGDKYLAPFAIATGMSNSFVAILNSIWELGPIGQIAGSKILNKDNRKKLITNSLIFEVLGWALIILTGILYLNNFPSTLTTPLLIIALAITVISNGTGYPAWFSLMGDVVDTKYRGRWWGKRTTIVSFMTIIFAISSSYLLEYFSTINKKIIGFIIFFFIAFIARVLSIKLMTHHYDPKTKTKKSKLNIKSFIKDLTKTNFGKFTLYRSIFGMAMGITTALVPIYLLRTLELSYTSYILITLSGTIFSVITLNLWGKLADTFGNYKIIAITSILIPFTPLLYILSSNTVYLFLVPGIIGGTSWSAFILVSKNFIYDNVKKEERGKSISYFNLFVGISTFIGGLIGSALITSLKTTWIKPIILIFLIGTALRIIIAIFWIPKIHDARKSIDSSGKIKFENIFFKQIKPTITEDFHEIQAIPRYLKEK